MVGSSGPAVNPRMFERWPWSKTHTSAPNAALSESAFMSTAFEGKNDRAKQDGEDDHVVISTNPMASGVCPIM